MLVRDVLSDLPIAPRLDAICKALDNGGAAVLIAEPGAGKTTAVPLALAETISGRIILVEPRRLAARAAARRMASLVGGRVGHHVGQAMRFDTKQGADTRILVVTEGVFTRMAIDDPELVGVSSREIRRK